jgi:hypothetical protein
MTSTTALTIRVATSADAPALERLAALDSAKPLTGTVLLAESGGSAVAALSSADGRTVADPFVPTAGVVALLRVHAAGGTGARRSGLARSLARLSPARLRPV